MRQVWTDQERWVERLSDEELRRNHDFVMAFEALRRTYGYREMSDAALTHIAAETGIAYEGLRIARALRNALAHGDPVNRETLAAVFEKLTGTTPMHQRRTEISACEESGRQAYRIHAWQDERLEDLMLANGFVSMGGAETGDLSQVEDCEVIRGRLKASMPDRTSTAIGFFVGYWRRFLWAEVGDLVVLPTCDRSVSIGEFVGRYGYVAAAQPQARHRRAVSWLAERIDRDRFDPDLRKILSGRHTVQEFTSPGSAQRLLDIATRG